MTPAAQGPDFAAMELQAQQSADWFLARGNRPDLIVIEWPTVYANKEEDPNDLLCLTAVNAGIVARLRAAGVKTTVRPILARLWTEGTPKKIRQARYLKGLSEAEAAIVGAVLPKFLRHNTVDSCHMAEWVAKRVGG